MCFKLGKDVQSKKSFYCRKNKTLRLVSHKKILRSYRFSTVLHPTSSHLSSTYRIEQHTVDVKEKTNDASLDFITRSCCRGPLAFQNTYLCDLANWDNKLLVRCPLLIGWLSFVSRHLFWYPVGHENNHLDSSGLLVCEVNGTIKLSVVNFSFSNKLFVILSIILLFRYCYY